MILRYSAARNLFYIRASEMKYEQREIPRKAGFTWHTKAKAWVTLLAYTAFTLYGIADDTAKQQLAPYAARFFASFATGQDEASPPVPAPPGCEYMDFQLRGIHNAVQQLMYDKAALIADPMGVGKTIQAIGVINAMRVDPNELVVGCPASLRLNWARELSKWLTATHGVPLPVLNGKTEFTNHAGPVIISYDLAGREEIHEKLLSMKRRFVILDEAHRLKNKDTKRTRAMLGTSKYVRNTATGIIENADNVILLTGTPAPNRAYELFYLLKRCAPRAISDMSESAFINRYIVMADTDFGRKAVGAKNTDELSNRLRASGLMTRRSKASVLPQLPPKRFSMVVFPQDSTTRKLIAKEAAFDAREIILHGVPLDVTGFPELRREMGEAKVSDCVNWIRELLDGGQEKAIVFAYHTSVIDELVEKLQAYNPVIITGKTPTLKRQAAVDAFQNNPENRLFIGNYIAAGEGITLTAADAVVFVEADYVPGVNDQAIDRAHRIGQTSNAVNVYYLVVESSLDAQILSKAAHKADELYTVMDKNTLEGN